MGKTDQISGLADFLIGETKTVRQNYLLEKPRIDVSGNNLLFKDEKQRREFLDSLKRVDLSEDHLISQIVAATGSVTTSDEFHEQTLLRKFNIPIWLSVALNSDPPSPTKENDHLVRCFEKFPNGMDSNEVAFEVGAHRVIDTMKKCIAGRGSGRIISETTKFVEAVHRKDYSSARAIGDKFQRMESTVPRRRKFFDLVSSTMDKANNEGVRDLAHLRSDILQGNSLRDSESGAIEHAFDALDDYGLSPISS